MKSVLKKISVLLLMLILVMSFGLCAFAAKSTVTYEGGAEKFVFLPGSDYTDTDLFDNFKDVMPGDELTQKITIKNNYKGCDYIKLYMRAVVHNEKENPLTYSEEFEYEDGKDQAEITGHRDETAAAMSDFLSQLSMTVKQGNQVLFEASPDELDGLKDNVLIAKLAKGAETELTVVLKVPEALGNAYANRVGEVDWVFVAEERNNPNSDKPEESEEPEVYPYVPIIQAPKTGDSANLILWIAVLAGAAVAVIYVSRKRRRH